MSIEFVYLSSVYLVIGSSHAGKHQSSPIPRGLRTRRGPHFDTRPLKAQISTARPTKSRPAGAPPPRGRIGKLDVSRLICGGNLFSGFAHSGDLLYVSSLLKHYFSDDKILETLQLCETSGINTAVLRTDEHIIGVLKRYRQERGGKIQWIAQTYPTVANPRDNIKIAVDNGAVGRSSWALMPRPSSSRGRAISSAK